MPYKENDNNNILDCEKKKNETVRECAQVWPSVQRVETEDYGMHFISMLS